MFSRQRVLWFIFITVSASGCSTYAPSEEDVADVRKVLELRKQAIETENIEAYGKLIIDDYFDGRLNKEQLIAEMQSIFDQYDEIKLTQQRAPVEIKKNTARVIQQVVYTAKGLEKPFIQLREKILVRNYKGQWLMSYGIDMTQN